jgi:hypothetical protein
MFLPARTPYERQTLVEHVKDRVRLKGQIQVLMHDHRWTVRMSNGAGPPPCAACGIASDSTCCSIAGSSEVYCVSCAFGDHPQAA